MEGCAGRAGQYLACFGEKLSKVHMTGWSHFEFVYQVNSFVQIVCYILNLGYLNKYSILNQLTLVPEYSRKNDKELGL